jgi:hypothetical protein
MSILGGLGLVGVAAFLNVQHGQCARHGLNDASAQPEESEKLRSAFYFSLSGWLTLRPLFVSCEVEA